MSTPPLLDTSLLGQSSPRHNVSATYQLVGGSTHSPHATLAFGILGSDKLPHGRFLVRASGPALVIGRVHYRHGQEAMGVPENVQVLHATDGEAPSRHVAVLNLEVGGEYQIEVLKLFDGLSHADLYDAAKLKTVCVNQSTSFRPYLLARCALHVTRRSRPPAAREPCRTRQPCSRMRL